jgi:Uma2 family endonuclease
MTLEEFLQLPETKPALEFIDGEVRQKVSPKMRHSVLQASLAGRINAVALPARVAVAGSEARAIIGGQGFVPDVSVYAWDRIPRDENGEITDDSPIAPDVAVEILSPGQSPNEQFRRCLGFVSNGVQIALLIDPDDRSVLAFFSGGNTQVWRGNDRIDLDQVVPGFEMTVDELFAPLRGTRSLRD